MSAEVGIESTLAGWASVLFSETSAAAVTWAIMKPELRPAFSTRNGGSPEKASLVSFSMRRSEIDAQLGERDGQEVGGERHRLAVEVAAREQLVRPAPPAKTSGLSVAEFISTTSLRSTSSSTSRTAPCTCGMQRNE